MVRAVHKYGFRRIVNKNNSSYSDRDSCFWQYLYVFSLLSPRVLRDSLHAVQVNCIRDSIPNFRIAVRQLPENFLFWNQQKRKELTCCTALYIMKSSFCATASKKKEISFLNGWLVARGPVSWQEVKRAKGESNYSPSNQHEYLQSMKLYLPADISFHVCNV
jgi:hypothetical protein